MREDTLEKINSELKKLTDVVYKFSAGVQSAGAGQQNQQQAEKNTTEDQQKEGQENNEKKN